MTFNTGNPIGSTDARDLSDNAENFDTALGTTSATWVDRLGVTRDSFEGRLAKGSFYRVGDFATGYTLTNMRQTLAYGNVEYSWSGAFPKVVAAGATPATSGGIGAGAWVDRTDVTLRGELAADGGASLIGYQRTLPSGYLGTVQDFINDLPGVNIWEFASLVIDKGTLNDPATWDWTPAFVAAIASGRKIIVPEGSYIGGNITPLRGLILIGAGGESSKTLLKVKAGATGFFTPNTSSNDYTNVIISGVAVTAEDNSSSFWKQSSNAYYTAYAYFYDVNIYQNVLCGFSGFFIFTEWHKCRSGYNGSGAAHSFISSLPAAFGQDRQTNLCQLRSCRLFYSRVNPMVDIAYGARWDFEYTDFERCSTVAIRSRGVYGGSINGGWLESCSGPYNLDINISPTPNPQGSRPWSLSNTLVNLSNSSGVFANIGYASVLRIDNTVFASVPSGGQLKSGNGLLYVGDGVEVLSGDSSAFRNQNLPSASIFPNSNPLPFGEYGVESAYLTNNGFSSVVNGASYLDPVNQTARLTLSATANAAYYTIPAKVFPLLRGKKVRVKVIGSFVSAVGADNVSIGIWDSVVIPTYYNKTSSIALSFTTETDMASATADVTVGADATSFSIGIIAGGGAAGAVFVIESISMQII